jgi:hypothetical protein
LSVYRQGLKKESLTTKKEGRKEGRRRRRRNNSNREREERRERERRGKGERTGFFLVWKISTFVQMMYLISVKAAKVRY